MGAARAGGKGESQKPLRGARETAGPSSAGPSVRVIKKYPNRRLYDTQSSAYVALADLKDLVLRFEPFVVQDAKTAQNLTRSILLQIILEEETGGAPVFSEVALSNIIRLYGQTWQSAASSWMEQVTEHMLGVQVMPASPLGLVSHSMKHMHAQTEQFWQAVSRMTKR